MANDSWQPPLMPSWGDCHHPSHLFSGKPRERLDKGYQKFSGHHQNFAVPWLHEGGGTGSKTHLAWGWLYSANGLSFNNDNRIPLFVMVPDISTLVPGVCDGSRHFYSGSRCRTLAHQDKSKSVQTSTQCTELSQSGRRWPCSCSLHSSLFCKVNPLPILYVNR